MSSENLQKTSEIPGLNTTLPNETQPSTNDFTDFNSDAQANISHNDLGNSSQELADNAGEIWQELRHKTPATKNKYGYWIKRKGRPLCEAKFVNKTVDNSVGNDAENIKAQAKSLASNYALAHTPVYGAEGYDDKLLFPLETALQQYMIAKGAINIDPTWSVIFGAASYSFLVSQKPKNIDKTRTIFSTIKNWIFKNRKSQVVSTNVVTA